MVTRRVVGPESKGPYAACNQPGKPEETQQSEDEEKEFARLTSCYHAKDDDENHCHTIDDEVDGDIALIRTIVQVHRTNSDLCNGQREPYE